MRIVCMADTHGLHADVEVPDGDLLIHAGDCTGSGSLADLDDFCEWLAAQPHEHKVFIAGNHDRILEEDPGAAKSVIPASVTYLQDSGVTVGGLKIWGSPWTPEFCNWHFMYRPSEAGPKWARVPDGIDILVTHGPPRGVLDQTIDGRDEGCAALASELKRIYPQLHIFGHIHEAYGTQQGHPILDLHRTVFVNCAYWGNRVLNPPIVCWVEPRSIIVPEGFFK